MKEQIFIIIEDKRLELDIKGGSITLSFNNPMLAGLDKIKYSHSYTIQLPLTKRNAEALDMYGELGSRSSAYGKTFDAEYWVNGLPVLLGATLYVTGVDNEHYQCTLAHIAAKSLQSLKNNGTTLREIWEGNEWISWRPTDYNKNSKWFDNTKNVCYPIYNAGRVCWNERTGEWYTTKLDADDRRTLNMCPPPCVPVAAILRRLAQMGINWRENWDDYTGDLTGDYDLDRDGHDDIFTFGVIPLESTAVSKVAGMDRFSKKYDHLEFLGVWAANYYGSWMCEFLGQSGRPPRAGEGAVVELDIKGLQFYLADAQNIREISVYSLSPTGEEDILAVIWPTSYTETMADYDQIVQLPHWPLYDRLCLRILYDSDNFDISMPDEATATIYAYYPEGFATHDLFIPECLPELKVWDVLKTLTAMYRGVPNDTGELLRYETIKQRLADRFATDWSGKVLPTGGATKYDAYTMSIEGLAQRNYYLMGNEAVDKAEGGGYKVTKCNFAAQNPWLQASAEMIKSVFYPAFLQNDKYPFQMTGGTIHYWSFTDEYAVSEIETPKPSICRVNIDYNSDGSGRLGLLVLDFPANHWDGTLAEWLKHPEVVEAKMLLNDGDIMEARRWLMPIYVEELRGVFLVVNIEYRAGNPSKVKLLKVR